MHAMLVRALARLPHLLLKLLGWSLNVGAAISFLMLSIYASFLFEPPSTHNHAENVSYGLHFVIPQSAAVLLVAIIGRVLVSRAKRRQYRLLHRLCPSCGYDLRASPQRCPECGAQS
jgi:predicted RNA-binding Zn-ribbon protein involved in translation (DUF1610 family)